MSVRAYFTFIKILDKNTGLIVMHIDISWDRRYNSAINFRGQTRL